MVNQKYSPHVPLFMPVLCYGLGIVAGNIFFSIKAYLAIFAFCIAVSIFFHILGRKFRRITYAFILLCFFCFGSFRFLQSYYYYSCDHIICFCQNDNLTLATIKGEVISEPEIKASTGALSEFDLMRQNGMSFDLLCSDILIGNSWQPVTGIVRVYLSEPMLELSASHSIELSGRIYRRQSAETRSPFYTRKTRVLAACSVDHNELVKINHNINPTMSYGSCLTRVRTELRNRLGVAEENPVSTGPGNMFAALLLGDRAGISPETKEAFIAGGTMHFLSLSGLHVGMLTGLIWLIVRPFRINRFWQGMIPAVVTLVFILIVPARGPVLRAGLISIFFCLGYISRRKSSPVNLLALSAFLILIFRPLDIFDAGFQLSYSITLALVIITPSVFTDIFRNPEKIRLVDYYDLPLLDDRPWLQRQISMLRRTVISLSIVSIVAWLVSLPIIAWHFNRVAWLAPLNSVIMALPVSMTMLAGLVRLLVSLVLPAFAIFLEPILDLPGELLLSLAQSLASIDGTSENVAPVPILLLIIYLLSISFNLLFAFYKKYSLLRRTACITIICVIAFMLLAPFRFSSDTLKLHFLPAGHGCVTIIELPNGGTILYDCGSYDNFDLGEYSVVPYLRRLGCNSIDAAIISHSDMDHYSALPDVAARIKIDRLFVPLGFGRHFTASDYRFMELVDRESIPVTYLAVDDRLTGGNIKVNVLWPPDGEHESANESSLVVKIISEEKTILLCGDITPEVMRQLLDGQVDLAADYLLLPHHGELSDILQDFVDAVSPNAAILSARRPTADKRQALSSLCPYLYQPQTEKPVIID